MEEVGSFMLDDSEDSIAELGFAALPQPMLLSLGGSIQPGQGGA
jgi:hypothetical protein